MKLAAVGSNCVDYYKGLDGKKAYPGGGPVNMAVYTVRMGGEAAYIGPVGNDEFGKIMKDSINSKGVDTSHVNIKEGNTAVTQVDLKDGERILGDYDEGVLAEYRLTEEDMEFIKDFDVVVCDLWGKVEDQFKDMKKRGIITAFDCATRPDSQESKTAIPYSDYVFFSVDDGDTESNRNLMKSIYEKGPSLVICMMGEKGSMCYDGENFHTFGIVPCDNIVDSMGAGDSYIAGFLKGIAEKKSIEEAMQMGASNATETLKYFGAW